MLVAIFIPLLAGLMMIALPVKNRKFYIFFCFAATLLTALLAWILVLNPPEAPARIFVFMERYPIEFRIDGMSRVFMGLISSLWPLATLYSYEYMEHEASENTLKEKTFFGMYTITYGVTLAIAMSANILTMYLNYELLTLVTIPLVLFTLTREAIKATRAYMVFSLGGAAFGFIALVFIMYFGRTIDFVPGGVLDLAKVGTRSGALRMFYLLGFLGFGVKAAVFPVNAWLPKASVAPTPVTALLHAVAVVKSGAFAIMRLTYFSFGADYIKGTHTQYYALGLALFTILFGCTMALKERHIKRRLAYSTISNLSYVLFATMLLTPEGLHAALSFMVFHGVMKITAFFCVGAYITKGERKYIYDLNGIYREMPFISIVFVVASIAIMGVPGLPGFAGKWLIAQAALHEGSIGGYAGIVVLMISSLLTAIYMLQPLVHIFFYKKEDESLKPGKDPGVCEVLPLTILVIGMLLLGLGFIKI